MEKCDGDQRECPQDGRRRLLIPSKRLFRVCPSLGEHFAPVIAHNTCLTHTTLGGYARLPRFFCLDLHYPVEVLNLAADIFNGQYA
jgi:hypothetical protein